MRTSVDLNDRLLTLAKQTATRRGITLREVFEQALRAYLEPTRKLAGYRFELPVIRGELPPGVPLHDWAALKAVLDDDSVTEARRALGDKPLEARPLGAKR